MSVADKITRLKTARDNIRTALASYDIDASDHGYEDFANDIEGISIFDPDDYIIKLVNRAAGERIEPDPSEIRTFSNIQTDGTTSSIVNTGLHLFSNEFPSGFNLEINFDNIVDEGSGQYRRILGCEQSKSPYSGLNITRKQNSTDIAILSLNNGSNNELEFQLLSTNNVITVEYDVIDGSFNLVANGQTLNGKINIFTANDTLLTFGGQFWSGGTTAAGDRCAKVKINSATIKPIKREIIVKREYEYIGKSTDTITATKYRGRTEFVEVNLPTTIKTLKQQSFAGCSNLRYINLENIITVEINTFLSCFNLISIDAPNLINLGDVISANQSKGDYALTEVIAPKALTLPYRAFFQGSDHFYNLKYIDVRGATSIANEACKGLKSLQNIRMDNVSSIGNASFVNCSNLNIDINLPNLTSLSDTAFQSCPIKKVINLGSITTLGGTFGNCFDLNFIRLPNTLTELKAFALQHCGSNMTVICEAVTPPSYGSLAFTVSNVSVIYVPDDSVDTYKAASGWSQLASKIHPLSEYTGTD